MSDAAVILGGVAGTYFAVMRLRRYAWRALAAWRRARRG